MCGGVVDCRNALNSRSARCSTQIGPRTSHNPCNTNALGPAHSYAYMAISAGEIAERGSFVDLGDVSNARTDQKHGCVSANVSSRFRVQVGGKPRTVCAQARPELQVFPFDECRDIPRNKVENHWVVFGTKKREPAMYYLFRNFEVSANKKL